MKRRRLNPHHRPRDTSLWPTGAQLRTAREQAGATVPELAARLKWSRASLYEYERAPRVDPEYARAIFEALGIKRPDSPLELELVASGTCADGCVDGHDDARYYDPGPEHRWWDYALTVEGRAFPSRYRLHAYPRPGDAAWHEVPDVVGPITAWIFADMHERSPMLTEAVIRAADPWPGSGFDPAAYRVTPPWKLWEIRPRLRVHEREFHLHAVRNSGYERTVR